MKDPNFQAVWHQLNEAQVALVIAHDTKDKNERRKLPSDAQVNAKRADVMLRQLLADRGD